jgi:hypothetical protein
MDSLQHIADHYGTDAALLVCGLRHISGVDAGVPHLSITHGWEPSSSGIISRILEHDLPSSILGCRSLSECLSAVAHSQFLDQHRGRALRALARGGEMASVSKTLEEAGFEVRFWKGAALSMLFHGDLTTRPSRDIDLLVKQEEILPIRKCMMKLGYEDVLPLDDSIIPAYLTLHREWAMRRKITGGQDVYIELQTAPVMRWSMPRTSKDMAFSGLDHLDLGGVRLPIPDPTTHFLLVAAHHGLSEGWRQLRQVFDLVSFARLPAGTIHWEKVSEVSRCMDFQRSMMVGWGLARDLAGARIPEHFQGMVDQQNPLITMAKSRLLRSPLPVKSELTMDAVIWQWRLASNLRSRSRLLLGQMQKRVSPGYDEFRAITLPHGMHALYYLLKPFRPLLKATQMPS